MLAANRGWVFFLGLGLMLVGLTPAEGTDWQHFFTNEGLRINLYYDAEGMKHFPGGLVRVWVKTVPLDEKGRNWLMREKEKLTDKNYGNFKYTLSLYELKCFERTYRIPAVVDYEKGGKILKSFQYNSAPWNTVPPDSLVEFLYMEVVCP